MQHLADHSHGSGPAAARSALSAAQSGRVGGGHYAREVADAGCANIYRVRKLCAADEYGTITQALAQWAADKPAGDAPRSGIIEIVDSATYYESPVFRLEAGERLTLRAASMERPVLRIFDYHTDEPGQSAVVGGAGSHFTLDGLCIVGGSVDVRNADALSGRLHVTLRHCTLFPGWDCERRSPSPWRLEPSLTLRTGAIALHLEYCIAGPVTVCADGSGAALPTMSVVRSILDGGHAAGMLLDDGHSSAAAVRLTVSRSTAIGVMQASDLAMAENSIFLGALVLSQRAGGAVRYCYLAPGSRTPSRMMCQPDLARNAPGGKGAMTVRRVRPRFVSLRCGSAGYGQLAPDCDAGIVNGADDDSAMGPFHDAHHLEPQPASRESTPDMVFVSWSHRPLAGSSPPITACAVCATTSSG